jgi:hypothetical protein
MKNTMTVRELINILAQYDLNAEVRFRDTYWEDQGYGSNAQNPRMSTRSVFEVIEKDMKDGKTAVVIC